MQTKDLEIPKEMMEETWQTNKVKIKKWTLGIRNEILDEVSKLKPNPATKSVSTEIQGGFSQLLIMLRCTVEAPWKVGDISAVRDLDPLFGDWLYSEITEFNGSGGRPSKKSQGLEESSKEI